MQIILNKIEQLMKVNSLSASEFSERINVNKATLSHLLSGRNKPSLEFILKVCEAFEGISPNDLLIDKDILSGAPNPIGSNKSQQSNFAFDNSSNFQDSISSNSEIERIVIFFKDQTFKEYKSL